MQIIVQGHLIETREIWSITEAPYGFHGFQIHLIGNTLTFVGEKSKYESSNYELSLKNDAYRKLREQVEAKWKEDKTSIPIYKL